MENKKNINWKKIGYNLIYPHLAIILTLLPIAITCLVLSLVYLNSTSILAILSYLLSFYTLLTICFRTPTIIRIFKDFKANNKFMQKWFSDAHLRINVTLYGSLVWNIIFATFQLILGFYHKSFWFYSLSAYYVMLGVIRFFLLKHTRKYKANEQQEVEIKKYVFSGWLLLFINLALAVIVFFIVYWNRTFNHNTIETICLATYTFLTFTFAIINLIKYKKYNSPVYSAAKSISLIAGCVSILTLETTMLTTFGTNESAVFRQILLSLTGIAVIGFAITMALIMIIKGHKQLELYNKNTLE